jgi:beta-galactosidase
MEKVTKPVADGPFHPEEWQTLFHEKNWEELSKRPFIWGKYVWCLKDFASSVRTEGDQNGINDKGLVTYDGKIKKDAFYFYRANWNAAPTLYLAEKRNDNRRALTTEVKAYTNAPKVTLLVNGTSVGRAVPDKMHIVRWHMVSLKTGNNNITIKALMNGRQLEDQCTWNVATTASANTMTP